MQITDFSKYAQPLIDQLVDDPNQPPFDEPPSRRVFPFGEDLEGDLQQINPDDDDSLPTFTGTNRLSEVDINAARGVYPMAGVDVLAFYKSFRFLKSPPFRDKWGIFLIDSGVAGLAGELSAHEPSLPIPEAHRLAMDLLLAHERYHFWIDAWALGQEITPFGIHYRRYEPYLMAKAQVELTPDDREESLANHYAFKKLKRRALSNGKVAAPLLRKVLELAPVPYSNFEFDKHERSQREGYLALAVANGTSPLFPFVVNQETNTDPSILGASLKPADRWHPVAGYPTCPVYYVHAANYARLIQPFQGPDLGEFKRFVTGYLAGQHVERTDHDYYRIDNLEKVKMPNPHDKTARGYELKGTLFKAGMTHGEYLKERQRTDSWKKKCPRPKPKAPLDAYRR
jgi:hypothetical protein